MLKFPRTIRLDPSDTFVFERAAEPGEWAVSGAFVFWNRDAATLDQKQRVALRSGFLGIDSLGWEWTPIPKLGEYFNYIKERENKLWVATFGDVTKYMREREHANVLEEEKAGAISISLTHSLDQTMYDLPLTLKTYVPANWSKVNVTQGTSTQKVDVQHDEKGAYVLCQLKPNSKTAFLRP